ncbi:hypothetical protein [Pseudomonas fluorescens]|uniref:Secreted protein n=1 Tax=Pseudomonas fluorescens TaxID=294 RepID=A0A5E7FKM1_PSEFL|nr:hypothetical protein [Pseudomonas fluorescens]VVO39776.1 hypothetical protein PS723_05716 [Pseudomonas fluorescens]
MKRSILFLVGALVATPLFAADDLCAINLQKIRELKATPVMGQPQLDKIRNTRMEAEKAQAAGDTKKCISLTNQALQDINNAQKNQ